MKSRTNFVACFAITIFVCLVCSGCTCPSSAGNGATPVDGIDAIEVDRLRELDAVAFARRSYERGDYRFIAIRGFSLAFPGLFSDARRAANREHYILPGTSDMIDSEAERRMNVDATSFAIVYNTTLANLLSLNNVPPVLPAE